MEKPKPLYDIGERVKVSGWGGSNVGVINDIQWIYHYRMNYYTWGYLVKFDDGKAVLSLTYAPEGYLRKIEESSLENKIINI